MRRALRGRRRGVRVALAAHARACAAPQVRKERGSLQKVKFSFRRGPQSPPDAAACGAPLNALDAPLDLGVHGEREAEAAAGGLLEHALLDVRPRAALQARGVVRERR